MAFCSISHRYSTKESPQSTPLYHGQSRARIIDVAPVSFHQYALPCVSHEGNPSSTRLQLALLCQSKVGCVECKGVFAPRNCIRRPRRPRKGISDLPPGLLYVAEVEKGGLEARTTHDYQ